MLCVHGDGVTTESLTLSVFSSGSEDANSPYLTQRVVVRITLANTQKVLSPVPGVREALCEGSCYYLKQVEGRPLQRCVHIKSPRN